MRSIHITMHWIELNRVSGHSIDINIKLCFPGGYLSNLSNPEEQNIPNDWIFAGKFVRLGQSFNIWF